MSRPNARVADLTRYAFAGAIAALPLALVAAALAELGYGQGAGATALAACVLSLLPILLGGRVLWLLRGELPASDRAQARRRELPQRAFVAVAFGLGVIATTPALVRGLL